MAHKILEESLNNKVYECDKHYDKLKDELSNEEKDILIHSFANELNYRINEKDDEGKGGVAYRNFSNFINNTCADWNGFIKAAKRDHRYLQSEFIRLMFKTLEGFADENHGTDPRNEYSVECARKVVKFMKENYII